MIRKYVIDAYEYRGMGEATRVMQHKWCFKTTNNGMKKIWADLDNNKLGTHTNILKKVFLVLKSCFKECKIQIYSEKS